MVDFFKIGDIQVKRSYHLNESRNNTKFVRDQFIDEKRYKDIIKSAKMNGLTSFRNKGKIVINFKDSWGLHYGLLCELKDDDLSIITIFNSKKIKFWTFFVTVQNRINLWNCFEMKCMNKLEYERKKKESREQQIDMDCLREDKLFLKAMKGN